MNESAFDSLADALSYPTAGFRSAIMACRAALDACAPAAAEAVAAFERATAPLTVAQVQELYTSTFDFDPRCTLDVGWHVFGDGHERGAFLAMLRDDLRAAGVAETSELPDHLTQILRLAARAAGRDEIREAGILALDCITASLETDNPYVHLLRGIRGVFADPPLQRSAPDGV